MKVSWLKSKKENKVEGEPVEELKLSSPWVIYFREIESMFGQDPEIKLEFDEENYEIKLFVDNPAKANALAQLLPTSKRFSGVDLKISIIPSNADIWRAKLIPAAFEGNPVFKDMQIIEGVMSNPICYVVFKKEVVQYHSDNLGDIHQITSTLYQNIAEDLFDIEGVCYCTDIE